jgi:chromosome segregation ATPase
MDSRDLATIVVDAVNRCDPIVAGLRTELDEARAALRAALLNAATALESLTPERDALRAEVERLTKERDHEKKRGDWLDGAYDDEVRRRYQEAGSKIEYWHKEADGLRAERDALRAAIEPTEENLKACAERIAGDGVYPNGTDYARAGAIYAAIAERAGVKP